MGFIFKQGQPVYNHLQSLELWLKNLIFYIKRHRRVTIQPSKICFCSAGFSVVAPLIIWIQSKPFLSCCEESVKQDSICLLLTIPRELQSGSISIIPEQRGPSHGRLTAARMHKRWARAKHSQPSSIFGLMREALVELNLQRQWRDIIICHLGSQQNRWHHLEQAARGKRWNYGPQRLSRIHQTLLSCHKPMPSVEKTSEIK